MKLLKTLFLFALMSIGLKVCAQQYQPPAAYTMETIWRGNYKPSSVHADDQVQFPDKINRNFFDIDTTVTLLKDRVTVLEAAGGGGGDVFKVGTPGDDQVGVWTGDGTIEGTSGLIYDGTSFDIVGPSSQYVYIRPSGSSTTFYSRKNSTNGMTRLTYNNSASNSILDQMYRGGGTATNIVAAPTDAIIHKVEYNVYDDVPASRSAGSFTFEVDGVIGTDDFDTKYTWFLKEGASANALMLTLGVDGLEYNADHSIDQAVNDLWVPDKKYVDESKFEEISYTSCPANSTTNIIVGSTTTDVAIVLRYIVERNTGVVVEKIMGMMEIIYDDLADDVAYFPSFIPGTIDVDLGVLFTADVNGTDIRMNIIVDNSNANTLSFDSDLIHKFYE